MRQDTQYLGAREGYKKYIQTYLKNILLSKINTGEQMASVFLKARKHVSYNMHGDGNCKLSQK